MAIDDPIFSDYSKIWVGPNFRLSPLTQPLINPPFERAHFRLSEMIGIGPPELNLGPNQSNYVLK